MVRVEKKRGTFTIVGETGKYFLGLDAGNTVIKAVLFDLEGFQVASYTVDGQSLIPEPRCIERDLDALWCNATAAIRGCISKSGISAGQIAAIGCAGHGNGLYLLDQAGNPLIGIQSLDVRAAELAAELNAAHGEKFHQICLQKPWPSQTPTLLAWIKRNQPELYDQAETLLLCKDFINYKLTGERTSEMSDMSGCGLTRMPSCTYDNQLLTLYGLEDATGLLPRLINPADIAGTVTLGAATDTGLAPDTPVIGGYFDVVASAMGSGVGGVGEASIIAGTWSINQVVSAEPVIDPSVFMVSHFGPGCFANIEASATSAANLEWYVREFVERGAHCNDPFEQCNLRVGQVTPSKDDPFFHPFLYGSAKGAGDRAGFYGIASWHGEGHMLRALFEGVMFEHRRHISVLQQAGLSFDSAVLSGGGSRSPHWPQMFADCLGVPITVAEARETGALGAAIGAACAVGEVDSYGEGITRMTHVKRLFEPNAAMFEHYSERYDGYLELAQIMRDFWLRADGSKILA